MYSPVTRKSVISFACLLLLATPAAADNSTGDNGWSFELAPLFLWGMNINGNSQIGAVDIPLDIEFKDDVLENLDAVFTIHFEAKKDKWSLFTEYQYADISPTAEIKGGALKIDIDFQNTLWELGAAYRVARYGNTDIELLGGARYTRQENKTKIKNGPTLVDVDEAWWDGFFGGRIFTQLSNKWGFVGRVDVGTGGSDRVWNLIGFFDYRFKEWGSLFVGYKWMDYDYDNGKSGANSYTYDATQQGPLAGITFYW